MSKIYLATKDDLSSLQVGSGGSIYVTMKAFNEQISGSSSGGTLTFSFDDSSNTVSCNLRWNAQNGVGGRILFGPISRQDNFLKLKTDQGSFASYGSVWFTKTNTPDSSNSLQPTSANSNIIVQNPTTAINRSSLPSTFYIWWYVSAGGATSGSATYTFYHTYWSNY